VNKPIKPENVFLTVSQVADRYFVSTDTIWRWVRNGDFPKPVHLSLKTTRWRMSDVVEHESSLRCGLIWAA
jgi:prophage regulatory protein